MMSTAEKLVKAMRMKKRKREKLDVFEIHPDEVVSQFS